MSRCYCASPLSEGNLCEKCLLHLNERQKLLIAGKKVRDGIASMKLVAALENVTPVLGMTLLDEIDIAWFRMEYRSHLLGTVVPSVALSLVEEYACCHELIEVTYVSHNSPGWEHGFGAYISIEDVCLSIRWDEGVEGVSKTFTYRESPDVSLEGTWSAIESIDLIREFESRDGIGDQKKPKEIEKLYCINELIQCLPKDLWEFRR